jgi:hypothetical protein
VSVFQPRLNAPEAHKSALLQFSELFNRVKLQQGREVEGTKRGHILIIHYSIFPAVNAIFGQVGQAFNIEFLFNILKIQG